MNDYVSLRVEADPCTPDITDLLASFLADIGYESFEADSNGLTAYIKAEDFDTRAVADILNDFPMETALRQTHELVEGRDWNEEWEKNYFQPIVIGEECVIHSTFHKDVPQARYDIVIDPKMAFGTGHHSTTSLMIGYLLSEQIEGKDITDMGTGTGILAILGMMRGARSATGVEIDEGAWINACENALLNGVHVKFIHGDASSLKDLPQCDIFIANINRNIILADLPSYAANLRPGGTMLLSGFYLEDVEMIRKAAVMHGLTLVETRSDNNWAALRLLRG